MLRFVHVAHRDTFDSDIAGAGPDKPTLKPELVMPQETKVRGRSMTWMTLSCGVNDVWHGERGVPLSAYKKNITEIVEKAQAAGIKVMILTATMIGEEADILLQQA